MKIIKQHFEAKNQNGKLIIVESIFPQQNI